MCQGDEGVLTSRFFGPKTELEANDYIMSLELHLSDFEDIHLNDSTCFIYGYTTSIRI